MDWAALYRDLSTRYRFTPEAISSMTLPQVYHYMQSDDPVTGETPIEARGKAAYARAKEEMWGEEDRIDAMVKNGEIKKRQGKKMKADLVIPVLGDYI